MTTAFPQIDDGASKVNAILLAAELDDVYSALLADADNPKLYHEWQHAIEAYHDACLPPWCARWNAVHAVPRRWRFKEPDRRSNMNALRRAVTAAKRGLKQASRQRSLSKQVAAEAALVAAQDALQIYRQQPGLLTPAELQSAIGVPHEHEQQISS